MTVVAYVTGGLVGMAAAAALMLAAGFGVAVGLPVLGTVRASHRGLEYRSRLTRRRQEIPYGAVRTVRVRGQHLHVAIDAGWVVLRMVSRRQAAALADLLADAAGEYRHDGYRVQGVSVDVVDASGEPQVEASGESDGSRKGRPLLTVEAIDVSRDEEIERNRDSYESKSKKPRRVK